MIGWCDTERMAKKAKRPRSDEDGTQSAFRVLQHVIEQTERPTPKATKKKVGGKTGR
jgi:hypothetical protein